MKKLIDKTYLENCFKNFYTYLSSNILHLHNNKTILDKIGESESGDILFDGKEVSGDFNESGKDGISPTVTTTPITGGHKVTITDAIGDHEFDVMDGEDGRDGKSAYEIAIDNSFVGTEAEWLQSLHGTDGITPHIDPNTKHWLIGDIDTEVVAEGADTDNVTLESLGVAPINHMHGAIRTITLSTTEPETVTEGELVLVYEE